MGAPKSSHPLRGATMPIELAKQRASRPESLLAPCVAMQRLQEVCPLKLGERSVMTTTVAAQHARPTHCTRVKVRATMNANLQLSALGNTLAWLMQVGGTYCISVKRKYQGGNPSVVRAALEAPPGVKRINRSGPSP